MKQTVQFQLRFVFFFVIIVIVVKNLNTIRSQIKTVTRIKRVFYFCVFNATLNQMQMNSYRFFFYVCFMLWPHFEWLCFLYGILPVGIHPVIKNISFHSLSFNPNAIFNLNHLRLMFIWLFVVCFLFMIYSDVYQSMMMIKEQEEWRWWWWKKKHKYRLNGLVIFCRCGHAKQQKNNKMNQNHYQNNHNLK